MKINRAKDVYEVPDWVVGNSFDKMEQNNQLKQSGVNRLEKYPNLVNECEHIEKCASNKQSYFYDKNWKQEEISHLKEYASVCGIKKVIGVDNQVDRQASSLSSPKKMIRTASKSTEIKDLSSALGDPFKLAEKSDLSHMEKNNWEKITPESKLADSPFKSMGGELIALRGGEDYRVSNQQPLAENQNSIADPFSLDRLHDSEEETTGERLARQAKERSEQRNINHEKWQESKVSEMERDNFKAQGVVFPTEVSHFNSGIKSSFMGAYSEADLQNLPEKTIGESLASINDERKTAIQREKKTDNNWDYLKASRSRMVSDVFSEELKKSLK